MGIDEKLLQDIAPHQIMVVGDAVPLEKVRRKNVSQIQSLLGQSLAPRCAECSAESGLAAAVADAAVRFHHRRLLAIGADAVIRGVGAFFLGLNACEVLLQELFWASDNSGPRNPRAGMASIRNSIDR